MSLAARLVLWDVDRTLLDVGGISRQVYAEAFQAVTGRRLERLADLAGRTDRDIILTTLALHGLRPDQGMLEAFYQALSRAVHARRALIGELGRCVPGARQALDAFAAIPELVQTVVTGNIRGVAELKLSAFDLAGHLDLDVGGYGCDDGQRAVLVGLAIGRAEHKHGVCYDRRRVTVIGDTPHDIAGALANGVRAVGVATGSSTVGDLRAAAADAVLPDLADTTAVVRAVLAT
jgi:phosphoglycolate phosphatase